MAAVITSGLILLITGVLVKNGVVWTIGIVVLLFGFIVLLLGMSGHTIGGRRHYF